MSDYDFLETFDNSVSLEILPETARRCVLCDVPYSTGELFERTNCNIHSFHQNCFVEEGACRKCQQPYDVFPLGPVDYLEGKSGEDMTITGFGYQWPRSYKYVMVTFHPEGREMYWYSFRTLWLRFERYIMQEKIVEFFLDQTSELSYME